MATVREPQQQRSIEKKNKIIAAGYEMFAEAGYFNTNTAEIAKRAGVSTGIVYGYFRDKRDILLEVLDIYIDNVFNPVFEELESIVSPIDFPSLIDKTIDVAVNAHKKNAAIHEALHALTSTDPAVDERFTSLEDKMTAKFSSKLRELGYDRSDVAERVHLAIVILQSYAHECVYDKHAYIDYKAMRAEIRRLLITLFD